MAAGYAFFQIVNNSLQQNINNILESQSTELQNNPIFCSHRNVKDFEVLYSTLNTFNEFIFFILADDIVTAMLHSLSTQNVR